MKARDLLGAIHEAAHAVVAERLGIQVDGIEMHANGAGTTHVSGEYTDDKKLILLMAGLATGARLWRDWQDAASTDVRDAEQITTDPERLHAPGLLRRLLRRGR